VSARSVCRGGRLSGVPQVNSLRRAANRSAMNDAAQGRVSLSDQDFQSARWGFSRASLWVPPGRVGFNRGRLKRLSS
jgi:hypothetical protein